MSEIVEMIYKEFKKFKKNPIFVELNKIKILIHNSITILINRTHLGRWTRTDNIDLILSKYLIVSYL